jgi:peptidoglycan/LPS O-acetylase OafA/YrhL
MAALLPGQGRANAFLLSGPVQFLGRISYSLYAVHFVVLVTLCSWVFGTTGAWPTALRDAAALLVMLGGSLALAALITRSVDVPGQKLANRFAKWLRQN